MPRQQAKRPREYAKKVGPHEQRLAFTVNPFAPVSTRVEKPARKARPTFSTTDKPVQQAQPAPAAARTPAAAAAAAATITAPVQGVTSSTWRVMDRTDQPFLAKKAS